MTGKVDKGRSILNAADEETNPFGLILSEAERSYIYGKLNTIDNRTNALHAGRNGWRPQLKAAITAAAELAIIAIVMYFATSHAHTPSDLVFTAFALAFLILQKLNLLLSHETIEQTFARQDREDKKEAIERARRFKDMGCRDLSQDSD